MVSNKGLNSKEALDESTAINSSVMLSGARRVKEIPDRLDTQDYSIDPQNSDRGREFCAESIKIENTQDSGASTRRQRCKTRNVACHSAAPYVRRVIRIWCVSLSIFVSTIIASARADDFPIKKLGSFTWVVDYESFWSPDSRQIVLVSSRHGGMKVHVMNADSASHGSDMRQLTFGSDEDDSPAWSPDRQRIFFKTTKFAGATAPDGRDVQSDNKVSGEQIDKKMDRATIRVDGTVLKRLTNGGGCTYASCSLDGLSILHRRIDDA